MEHLNVEIKARCPDPEYVRSVLRQLASDFKGIDRQVDTYFHCTNGRLKLREGNIEQALIHYRRSDRTGPKRSEVTMYDPHPSSELKVLLTRALGVLVVVDKKREIHFVGNVKIHVDEVERLGDFVEIEAIADEEMNTEEKLRAQCKSFMERLGVLPEHLLGRSYSDMLLEKAEAK
ncbi:MAG: class IV adenylate cyclase [bacterium]